MAYTSVGDDEFAAFAKRAEEEANDQKNRNSGSGFSKDYDPIKWVGLEEKAKIVRIVGGAPASMKPGAHIEPTDAHEIFISKIIDDNGKRMKLKLPLHSDDPNHEHIMWRIINLVKSVDWIKGANGKADKKYRYEGKPYFDKIVHGGYEPTDPQYRFSKGWGGQQVVIMNVIDREDDWCKTNKHTKLLSKRIALGKDGTTEYPDDGVPSFGFCSALSTIVGNYGSWEHYDLQLRKTGQMQPPVEVKQATLYKKNNILQELDKDKAQFISLNESLTPEELEYERYDIGKFYAPTSYQKILRNLGNTIKAVDADLNKNFYNELQALAEKEKAEYEANHANDADANASVPAQSAPTFVPTDNIDPYAAPIPETAPITESVATPATSTFDNMQTVAPAATRTVTRGAPVAPATGLSAEKTALLKGWAVLTPQEKDAIVDVTVAPDGTLSNIIYKPEYDGHLVSCPETFPDGSKGCGKNSPEFFVTCPCCGKAF